MKKSCSTLLGILFSGIVFSQTSQYASSVISFSTQWSTPSWAASQTLNAPDTYPSYGDITTSWASASPDGQREFLVLGFTTPQPVSQVNIWETYNPGAVDTIFLRNSSNGQWVNVWSGTASAAPAVSRIFTASFPTTNFSANAIRIAINSPAVPSWNEIDAVQIQQLCGVTVAPVNVLCFGQCNGSATANPTGQAPFQYSWSPGGQTTQTVTGLCAGTYTVAVLDATTCASFATVTITQPNQVLVSLNATSCSSACTCDGSISSVTTGGVAPYTYNWVPSGQTTPNISGLCAGAYTLTVTDANGCTGIATATVTAPPAMQLSLSAINCSSACTCDGSLTGNITGGTGPYTFSWSPTGGNNASATGLCPGTYTLLVTDASGCTATASGTVTQPAQLGAVTSFFPPTCNGNCDGLLFASANGGTQPYAYSWFPSGCSTSTCSGICAGTYTLIVTDVMGCTYLTTVTMTQPTALSLNMSSVPASCGNCCDGSATGIVTGGTPGYTFLWTPGNQNLSTATGLCPGTYTLCVTDMNNCTICSTVVVNFSSGLENMMNDGTVSVYPVPFRDEFTLQLSKEIFNGNAELEIRNVLGEKVGALKLSAEITAISTAKWEAGIYFLCVKTGETVLVRRVVKE